MQSSMKGRAPLSSPRNRRRVRADPSHVNLQANDVWVQQRQDALGHCESKGKAPDVRGQAGRICFQKQPGSTSGLPALTGLKPDYHSAVAEENSLVNDYRATKQTGNCCNGLQASDLSKWGQKLFAEECGAVLVLRTEGGYRSISKDMIWLHSQNYLYVGGGRTLVRNVRHLPRTPRQNMAVTGAGSFRGHSSRRYDRETTGYL